MRKWALYWEKDVVNGTERWCVRQGNKRYPRVKYKHIEDNETELRQLVHRLNAGIRTREAVEIRHAFISPELLEEWRAERRAQLDNPTAAQVEWKRLSAYFLGFFINHLNLVSPLDWHRVHKTQWATYLLKDPETEGTRSVSSIRAIVQASNKFMAWLHERRPAEVPPLRFEPLSKAVMKKLRSTRDHEGKTRVRKLIAPEHWAQIVPKMPPEIAPLAHLGYFYGLRRSETLGVERVCRGYLPVTRQKTGARTFAPVKSRVVRDVPHWFTQAEQAMTWVKEAKASPLTPDQLTERWADLMRALGLDYDFHDLRHTWVTRAIREHAPIDVMRAAGHVNIETTMRYSHDDRTLDDEELLAG